MKPNVWVSSSQATELLVKQLAIWPLAENNFGALNNVRLKSFDMDGFNLLVQFNPARLLSSAAKTDAASIQQRPCFLCAENLPEQQEKLSFGPSYLLLCNPYPIFPQHFTIPSRQHVPQAIRYRFEDMLEMSRRLNEHTLFYNGPKCGASLPDHAHFQAVTRRVMPIDNEVAAHISDRNLLCCENGGSLYLLTHYLRNGFIIQARTAGVALSLFRRIYSALEIKEGETEPMMNLFSYYQDRTWTVVIIPRRKHRPWQYEAEGEERIVSSPGAADIGGLFIAPREEDFEKMTPELLQDIYNQVCLGNKEVEAIGHRVAANGK